MAQPGCMRHGWPAWVHAQPRQGRGKKGVPALSHLSQCRSLTLVASPLPQPVLPSCRLCLSQWNHLAGRWAAVRARQHPPAGQLHRPAGPSRPAPHDFPARSHCSPGHHLPLPRVTFTHVLLSAEWHSCLPPERVVLRKLRECCTLAGTTHSSAHLHQYGRQSFPALLAVGSLPPCGPPGSLPP